MKLTEEIKQAIIDEFEQWKQKVYNNTFWRRATK